MQQHMFWSLDPYITSIFSRHGHTPIIPITANLVGGVSQLPLARILNLWGRLEAYILVHLLCVIGTCLPTQERRIAVRFLQTCKMTL